MKYLFVKNGKLDGFYDTDRGDYMKIISDPTALLLSGGYNETTDVIYTLGHEVKMKVVIEPTNVYRTFVRKEDIPKRYEASENHPLSYALKDDLGVGDYRG